MSSNNSICSFFSETVIITEPKKKVSKKNTDVNTNINNKKDLIEETLLNNYINKGCCFFCMIKKCTKTHQNNSPFPDALPYFLERPMRINLLNDELKKEKFDIIFEKTQEYNINICTYIYAYNNCKNCEEGRFKFIEINGQQIKFCYPEINKNNNKLPIWLHIDLKFSINSNNRINILEVLPLNEELLTNNSKNNNKNNSKNNKYNKNDRLINDTNSVVSEMSFDNFSNFPKMRYNINEKDNHSNQTNRKFDYSVISKKHNFKEETAIDKSFTDENSITNNIEENISMEEKKNIAIDYSKENYAFLEECYDINVKKYIVDIEDKNDRLKNENAFLLINQSDFDDKIKLLEKQKNISEKKYLELSVAVEKRLEEINQAFNNTENLGNMVVETYRKTNIDKYKILSK